MMIQTSNGLIMAGRLMLALYFLVPGLMKFAARDLHIGFMEAHGVPYAGTLLWVAGITNVLGAILLFANRHVRLTALGFVLYILLVNLNLHDFWNYEGREGQHEMQNFIKNLGLMAGCLLLAGASRPRRIEFKNILASDIRV